MAEDHDWEDQEQALGRPTEDQVAQQRWQPDNAEDERPEERERHAESGFQWPGCSVVVVDEPGYARYLGRGRQHADMRLVRRWFGCCTTRTKGE